MDSFSESDFNSQKPITGSLDLTNGVSSHIFRYSNYKQRLLLYYTGEIPSVTAMRKILAPSLKLMLTQVTSRERK